MLFKIYFLDSLGKKSLREPKYKFRVLIRVCFEGKVTLDTVNLEVYCE